MNSQNLIIYKFNSLYHIFEEIGLDLNFKIIFIDSEKSLHDKLKKNNNHLVISNKKYSGIDNHFALENTPINIFKEWVIRNTSHPGITYNFIFFPIFHIFRRF